MRPLTVLHVNTERGFRGGEIQNLYLARGLRERGHRSILAVQEASGLATRATDDGLDVRETSMQGEFDPLAAAWLAGILRSDRPDVVHYHTSHAVTLGTLGRLMRPTPPTVATRRTSFPTRRNPLFRLKFTFRLDHVIAVSSSIRDAMVEAGLPTGSISVVHSGIDLERFRVAGDGREFRKELGVGPDDLLIGCVGALSPQKGHLDLVRIAAPLVRDFPNLHIALLGEGELMGSILDEARSLGIGDRIHLTGYREDVPQANAALDMSVLPSVAGEGSPAAVKEAMAAGVPIVATDVGGMREIVEDGRQGLIVPASDADALDAALRRLLGDMDLRRRLGMAGRERAREFSMERMVERTEEIYIRVCRAGAPRDAYHTDGV